MPALMPKPKQQYFGIASIPLIGGKIFTYAAGSSVPKATFSDAAGTTPQPNPIVLNARGEPPNAIFWDGSYRVVVQDALGNLIYTVDNYQTPLMPGDLAGGNASGAIGFDYSVAYPAGTIGRWLVDLALSAGSSFIGFIQAGVGAVARTVQDRLLDTVSIADFGPLGTDDDTATITKAINWLNARTNKTLTCPAGVYMVGKLPGLTAAGHTLQLDSVTWKSVPNSLAVAGDAVIVITGNDTIVVGLKIDGNQYAYTLGNSAQLLTIGGLRSCFTRMSVVNSTGRGVSVFGSLLNFESCHFDDNAALGMEMSQQYGNIHNNCTWDRNGWGFKNSRPFPASDVVSAGAFGFAARFRCRDFIFTNCTANGNGKDGMNVNQGSYGFRFIGCTANENQDGGFTLASDSTAALPGDGEACFDVEYIDCIAKNNWSSGLVAYQPAHNITVLGGRYYNNHRLAGKQTSQSSYKNGIYFAGTSTGISIDTKCYDDRQTWAVTATNGALPGGLVCAVPGWVAGTINYYPRVTVISPTGVHKGYANLIQDFAGQITIATSAFHGVTGVAVGDLISQCVQHIGVFIDNAAQGSVKVDGFGCKPGQGDSNTLVFVGGLGNMSNVHVEGTLGVELLTNPSFDAGITGIATNLPGGSAIAPETTTAKSAGSLKVVAGTQTAEVQMLMRANALKEMQGGTVRGGAWVYADQKNDCNITIFCNQGAGYLSTSAIHPGGGWKYLECNFPVSGLATDCFLRLNTNPGKTAYYDTVSFKTVSVPIDYRDITPVSRYLPF